MVIGHGHDRHHHHPKVLCRHRGGGAAGGVLSVRAAVSFSCRPAGVIMAAVTGRRYPATEPGRPPACQRAGRAGSEARDIRRLGRPGRFVKPSVAQSTRSGGKLASVAVVCRVPTTGQLCWRSLPRGHCRLVLRVRSVTLAAGRRDRFWPRSSKRGSRPPHRPPFRPTRAAQYAIWATECRLCKYWVWLIIKNAFFGEKQDL